MPTYRGKTRDEAIERGLSDLGLREKEAHITTVEEGRAGIAGFFSKEAVVEIRPLTLEEQKRAKREALLPWILVGLGLLALLTLSLNQGEGREEQVPPTTMTASSQSSSASSSTSKTTTSKSSSSSSSETSETVETTVASAPLDGNHPDVQRLLTIEDTSFARQFASTYQGQILEFDGHVAYISPHDASGQSLDVLIFGGDWVSEEETNYTGVAMQFYQLALTDEALSQLGGLTLGQPLRIRAEIITFTGGDLLRLKPIELLPR